ncbi:hypothetical protein [[Phormidium] sp. ETS-05]|uniref:hypothetical protein n=1 Tax=[Phormidium] sp. ETS-05 TaxID=222819 RepID=UPI0018EF0A2B|nr:hypothetical protein [[Phormidium] sp. ETS-05]
MTISSGVRPLTQMAYLWLRRQVQFGAVVLGNALKWGFPYPDRGLGEGCIACGWWRFLLVER